MLDLKELERKLDITLDKENTESLTNWLLKRRGWVKVSDKLPEPGDTVLTFPHYRVLPFGNLQTELEHDWSDTDFWDWEDNWGVVKVKHYPTHWIPLPDSPK